MLKETPGVPGSGGSDCLSPQVEAAESLEEEDASAGGLEPGDLIISLLPLFPTQCSLS